MERRRTARPVVRMPWPNITSAAGNALYVDVFSQSSVNAVSNGTDTFDIATTCTNSSNVACVENFNGWTGSGGYQHWLYCLPSTSIAGSNTVTVTLAGSSANFTVNYTAIFAGSCKLDSGATPTCTGSATFGTTVSCTSALALNASTDFVIATVNHSGTPTVASPWALLTAASPNTLKLIDVYQLSPASGTQNNNFATSGGSNSWNVMAVAFQ